MSRRRRRWDGDQGKVALTKGGGRLLKRLWRLIGPHRHQMMLAAGLMMIVSAAGLAGPALLQLAIDDYIAEGDLAGLNLIFAVYVGISGIRWAASASQQVISATFSQAILFTMRQQLFEHMQRLGPAFYGQRSVGRIMSRLTNDVDAINEAVSDGTVRFVNDVVTLVGIAVVMLIYSWELALVTFLTIPFIAVAIKMFTSRLRPAYHHVRRRIADVNASLEETISGIQVVQAFAQEERHIDEFQATNQRNLEANMRVAVIWATFRPLIELSGAVGICLVLWYGGLQVISPEAALGTGVLVAFIAYVQRLFRPIREMTQILDTFQSALASSERVFELMDEEPTVTDIANPHLFHRVEGAIRFEDVTFRYRPKDPPAVADINLRADPGEMIALVGHTGAGKTTLINLLARFYDPQKGRITVDGHDLREVALDSWRSQLGIVLQDNILFTGSIRDNIRFGRPDASDDEVVEAARLVNAHRFIMRLPEGYETNVRERGNLLSAGQRQLLAFARALLADPAVLILDEATSHVDSVTEWHIQQGLEQLLSDRTSVVIAHRLSTVRRASRIYVMEHARVQEVGSHSELLAARGDYYDLYRRQWHRGVAGSAGD